MGLQAEGPAPATCSGIFFIEKSSVTALESRSAGNLGNTLYGICWYFGYNNVLYRTWQLWKQKTDRCNLPKTNGINILIDFLVCEILMTFALYHDHFP